jgi:N-acyl-D-aspartate/D-glutamate deacylase
MHIVFLLQALSFPGGCAAQPTRGSFTKQGATREQFMRDRSECVQEASERRYDLPGGGKRMVTPSRGMRYTIVNGVTTYANGKLVGSGGGTVLRCD